MTRTEPGVWRSTHEQLASSGVLVRTARSVLAAIAILLIVTCNGSRTNDSRGNPIALTIRIDSVQVLNGQDVTVSIRFTPDSSADTPIDSIESYVLLLSYNSDMLSFFDAYPGGADSLWEYYTWRHYPAVKPYFHRGTVRIVCVRDLDNNRPPAPSQSMPGGVAVRAKFHVTSDRDWIGQETEISFSSTECTENALVDGSSATMLHIVGAYNTHDSLVSFLDTLNCPRLYQLSPDLEFVPGAVKILPPPGDTGPVIWNGP